VATDNRRLPRDFEAAAAGVLLKVHAATRAARTWRKRPLTFDQREPLTMRNLVENRIVAVQRFGIPDAHQLVVVGFDAEILEIAELAQNLTNKLTHGQVRKDLSALVGFVEHVDEHFNVFRRLGGCHGYESFGRAAFRLINIESVSMLLMTRMTSSGKPFAF